MRTICPIFQQLIVRTRAASLDAINDEDRARLLSLPFKLIITRHRLGLIDETIQRRILQARQLIRERASKNGLGVEFFDEAQYNPRISIQDNILFGKLVYGQANAQAKINVLIADVVDELDLRPDVIDAGLQFEVGVAGARLSATQRQKLGLARALMKAPDLLVVNEALAGLDTAAERRLIRQVSEYLGSAGIVWVLARAQLAEQFDRVLLLERGRIAGDGSFSDLAADNPVMQSLLGE